MVKYLWGLIMSQSMENKFLTFSGTSGEARKFVCGS